MPYIEVDIDMSDIDTNDLLDENIHRINKQRIPAEGINDINAALRKNEALNPPVARNLMEEQKLEIINDLMNSLSLFELQELRLKTA